MARSEKTSRTIQSVDRAVALLDALAGAGEGLSLSALADRIGLKPQTVQSLLRTLEAARLVVQAGRGEPYVLGPTVHEWSRRWLAGVDWAVVGRPVVAALGDRLGEYVVLSTLQGRTLLRLVEQRADRSLTVTPAAEGPGDVHTRATGKMLLASLDEAERQRVVAGLLLNRRGPNSVTRRGVLLKQLETIREAGFAECIEEASPGIAALAVPVDTPEGPGRLALGVSIPLVRYPGREALLGDLRRAAAQLRR